MNDEQKSNPLDLLRQAIEIAMPDLRHYLRPVRKAKIVGVYPSKGGNYYADVQPLRNDESVDPSEPVIPKVEIPVMWAGPNRGVVCPPVEGTFCDLSYYDGDPNYPRISNFRWHGMDAPEAELNEFVIQLEPGVEIRVDKKKHIVMLTPENVRTEAGKDIDTKAGKNWTVIAGDNATIEAGKEATLKAGTIANIVAPLINLCGRIFCKSVDGTGKGYAEFVGDVVIRGNETIDGNQSTTGNTSTGGNSTVGGNSYAGSRSGGSCPH